MIPSSRRTVVFLPLNPLHDMPRYLFHKRLARPLLRLLLLVATTLFVASCGDSGDRPIVLKLGHLANEDHIWHQSALHFAEQVDALSGGAMKVEVYPSEQLGKELEMIRSIQSGIIDMTVSGESMQNWTPFAAFCGMPYLVETTGDLESVINSSAGERIAQEIEREVGLKPIAYFARGPRHLTADRPITHPNELNGLILRVPSVPISIAAWNALGAKTTPMAFSEVFTALQSGTIQAQENPLALIDSAGFHEVQDYVNLTGHVVGWVYVLIGQKQFEALAPDQQEVVLEASKRMQERHRTLFEEKEQQLRAELESKGMEFVEVDTAAFKEIADKAVAAQLPEDIQPLYRLIKNRN